MRAGAAASVGCILAFAHIGAAHAQAESTGVERGLSAEATIAATYDDNVLRRSSAGGGSRSDYKFSPTVSLRYDLPVARQGVFVTGMAGYNFYARNSRLNRENWRVGGGVNWALGTRCTGLAEISYGESQSDFAEIGVALDNLQKRQFYSLSASCAGPAGIGFVAGVDRTVTDNSTDIRGSGDLHEIAYNAGLLYRSRLVGDVTLRGVREKRKYPNRFVLTPLGVERDGVKVERIVLAVARPIGARLQGTAGISYIWSTPDVSIYDKFKGVGWNAGLTYLVGPRLTVGLNASRDATSSAALDSSYQITRNYGANLSYQLGAATRISLGASDSRRNFRGEQVNPLLPLPLRGTEKTRLYYGEVGYSPTDRWAVALRYAHDRRNADGAFYDYSGNSVTLSASLRY